MIRSKCQIRLLVFHGRRRSRDLDSHFLRRVTVDSSHVHVRVHGTRSASRMARCEGSVVLRPVEQRHSNARIDVVRQAVGEELSEFLVVGCVDTVDGRARVAAPSFASSGIDIVASWSCCRLIRQRRVVGASLRRRIAGRGGGAGFNVIVLASPARFI